MATQDFPETMCVESAFQPTDKAGLENTMIGDRYRQVVGDIDFGRPIPVGSKPRRILRWVLLIALAIALGLAISVKQMEQGAKNDAKGVKDGDLPEATLTYGRT